MTDRIALASRRRGGIPRGLSDRGMILFSYGFRPFFLGGAIWACIAMAIWIATVSGHAEAGGSYGPVAWHAHEMLFGFGSAIVAGFLLTAVPNWTGRLPVSGAPLMALFSLWAMGRLALLYPDFLGVVPSALVEALFLPAMLIVCLREIIAGRKWADLKVVGGLAAMAIANLCFHYETIASGGPDRSERLALAGLVMMIIVLGGRMLPSFTRNWLNKAGRTDFPHPYGRFDRLAIIATLPAFAFWIAMPDAWPTAVSGVLAGVLQTIRLARWRGLSTFRESLLSVLHLAYALVPVGLFSIALSALGLLDRDAAIHVLTVGTVATMMLAVMTRATRGHTGRELMASKTTVASYLAIFLCALVRPLAAFSADYQTAAYSIAASMWIGAFALYLLEYGPMLAARRKPTVS